MNKYILSLVCLALLNACSNDDEAIGYGNIRFSFNTDKAISVATTRAAEAVPEEELANYLISVKRNGKTLLEETKYGDLENTDYIYPAGDNYVAYATSCTETESLTANEGFGQARYGGESTSYSITTGQTTDVNITCTMLNAKVNVEYANDFKALFSNYSLQVWSTGNPSRIVIFDSNATFDTQSAYFSASGTEDLAFKLTATYLEDEKELYGTINSKLSPKKWYKLTICTSNGNISLDITVDKEVEDTKEDIKVNPYN